MNRINWSLTGAVIVMAMLILFLYSVKFAIARDAGQWENTDPEVREWYQTLMQPDNPSASCCGEADAYWCDGLKVDGDGTFCQITDDRDDGSLRRHHVEIGTWIEIPDRKLKWDRGNPVGHAVVFLSSGGAVYCFVQNGGV